MTDFEHRMRDAVAEGAYAARQPDSRRLRRQMVRRRHRASATAVLLLAMVAAAGVELETGRVSSGAASQHGTLPTTEASNSAVRETMLATPGTINPGGLVAVTGEDCDPQTPVYISAGAADTPRDLATVMANGHGAFSAKVRIPDGTRTGPDALWAACKAPNPTGKLLHTVTIIITG